MTLVLVALQGWATEVNPASLQFSTDVGQTTTQTISIKFADAEIPPDPNTPVVMSPSYGNPLQSIGQASGGYSVSIQGAGSQMFSAEITMGSFTSNACTVKVSYNPSAEGTHQATLNVNCSSAGVPTVSVNLTGSTTSASDDPFTNLPTGLGSVTKGNGTGLPEGFIHPGFNPNDLRMDPAIAIFIYDLIWYLMTHPDEVQFWIERIADIIEIMSDFETWSLCIPNEYYDSFHALLPDFMDLPVGSNKKLPVRIVGYIQSPLLLQLDDNVNFSIDKQTIQPAEALFGTTIYIDYHPQSPGYHNTHIKSTTALWHQQEIGVFGTAIERTISVDPENWNFEPTYKDDVKTKKITVKGTHLTGDLMVTPSSFSYFTISPTTITAAQAQSTNGAEVTVTYNPTAVGSHSATFTISGGEALPETFSVSGNCINNGSITVNNTSLNMDPIYEGEQSTATFTITGENLLAPITLVEPWSETPDGNEFSVNPKTLPKTGGTVKVTYTPSGAHTSSAQFKFKSGDLVVSVDVTAKCLPKPTITRSLSSWNFGTVKKNSTHSKKITVRGYNLTGDLNITPERSSYFTISPTTITAAQAQSANGVEVTVTYNPKAVGSHSATFTISGGGATPMPINISGSCVNFTASPTSLNMDPVYEGEQSTATFTITGENLTAPITLVEPWMETLDGNEFSVSPKTLPKIGGTVKVTYTPSGAHTSGAQFKFKSGDLVVSVDVTAKCLPKPTITRSLSSWNFGTVKKNSTHTKKITVRGYNLTGDLKITPESSSYFTVSPSTITAAQAQSANGVEVTITYKPTARGSHSMTFVISGGGAASKTVDVSGKCAEITTTETSLRFASNYSQKFTVKGYYLTGDLTLSSDNAVFTVTPRSISASQAASGVEVTVKCNAALNLQSASGKITISGGSAAPKTVSLSYNNTGEEPQAPLVTPEDDGENGNDEFSNVSLQEAFGGPTSDVNELSMSSKVYAEGLNIIIETPIEQKALISDIAGHIREVNLQAGRNEVPVNANGIYIVRIREKSTKLMLK